MLELVSQYTGQLLGLSGTFQEASGEHDMSTRCGKCVDGFVVEHVQANRISIGRFGLNQRMDNDRQSLHQPRLSASAFLRNELPDNLFAQRLFP